MNTLFGLRRRLDYLAPRSWRLVQICCIHRGRLAACIATALLCTIPPASAATLHVWRESPSPAPPYADWSTAAHTIQDAVDAAIAGDKVLVTNGVYADGGRAVEVNLTNRVAITRPILVASVNGPTNTVIVGRRAYGDGPFRCVYLGTNARLSGFTLTNGLTYPYGDVRLLFGAGVWCRASAVISNCIIRANEGSEGGGVFAGTLYNCRLEDNTAHTGAGASSSTLNYCTITGNRSQSTGGGAYGSTLWHCTVTGNEAGSGGGVSFSTVERSIVYFNSANVGPNYHRSTLGNSCAWPLPVLGAGNIAEDPLLASATHLSSASPCRGRVTAPFNAVDIDREPWLQPSDLGADGLIPGAAVSPLAVSIHAPHLTVATGFLVSLTAQIEGQTIASRWNFGDGTIVSNQPFSRHAWTNPGTYPVTLTAFNDAHPQGHSATVNVQVVSQPVHYVNSTNTNPVFPYTNWATASLTIEEAAAASTLPGRLVLVTNGFYQVGLAGLELTNSVVVRSVFGPSNTLISSIGGTAPCVQLRAECVLSGFTISNGVGGGVWSHTTGLITNCILTSNGNFQFGGGAYGGTLTHCLIQNNRAYHGGGAYGCRALNCVFTGNTADYGSAAEECLLDHCTIVGNEVDYTYDGAVIFSMVYNSIVQSNTARGGAIANHNDNGSGNAGAFFHTSTTPLPSVGSGNFTNAPIFVNAASGDFHLRFGSPGIDAAGAVLCGLPNDLENRRRPLDGDGDALPVADIGAYEFDLLSVVSTNWLLVHGLNPNDPQVFVGDPDHDGYDTLDEWVADTNPTNAQSVLRITAISKGPPVSVQFAGSSNRLYTLRYASNPASTNWIPAPGQFDVPGNGGLQTLRHTNAVPPRFYRVGVRVP